MPLDLTIKVQNKILQKAANSVGLDSYLEQKHWIKVYSWEMLSFFYSPHPILAFKSCLCYPFFIVAQTYWVLSLPRTVLSTTHILTDLLPRTTL